MDRQLIAPKRTYANGLQTFRWTDGEFRIGMDGQIVCDSTNQTLANSNGAHEWITKHAHKADVARAKQSTRPPDTKPVSPLNDIVFRTNIDR